MRLQSLQGVHPVPKALWLYSILLGYARRNVHEGVRLSHRDRGKSNLSVDIQGVLAELFTWHQVTRDGWTEASQSLRSHLFGVYGGPQGNPADLIAGEVEVDVKAMDMAPNKQVFAVNARKHRELEGISGYYCILCPPRSKEAVSVYVPYSDVSDWITYPLGRYGDPSHNMELGIFLSRYGDGVDAITIRNFERYSHDELRSSLLSGKPQVKLLRMLPHLEGHLPSFKGS